MLYSSIIYGHYSLRPDVEEAKSKFNIFLVSEMLYCYVIYFYDLLNSVFVDGHVIFPLVIV